MKRGSLVLRVTHVRKQIGKREAGAEAHNLTESQFGMASIRPRWNLSGTYQQVIPRYVSTDAGCGDAREFLNDAFPDAGD